MQTDRFTTKAQGALQDAQRLGDEHSHQAIDGEHLLLALLGQSEGLIQPLLQKLGVPLPTLAAAVEGELSRRARNSPRPCAPLKPRPASSMTITSAPSICCWACWRPAVRR